MEGTASCANPPGDHDRAIASTMDAPGISSRHLASVIDAGPASLPGRRTYGYEQIAQAIIGADKHPDVDSYPDLPQ